MTTCLTKKLHPARFSEILVSVLSSNTHDKSMEVVMTGFFVTGPLMAVIGFVGTLIFRLVRPK